MDDPLTHRIIGAAIEVHSELGPGLLESAYEECLATEFSLRKLNYKRQVFCPLTYKSIEIRRGFRCDFIVEDDVIVELKTVEKLTKIHDAQVMTYLKLSGMSRGLLINFDSVPLKEGIHRLTPAARLGK